MKNITDLRAKYAKRKMSNGRFRHAPGGADVHRLCDIYDRMEQIVLQAQRWLPVEQQREIQRALWSIENL